MAASHSSSSIVMIISVLVIASALIALTEGSPYGPCLRSYRAGERPEYPIYCSEVAREIYLVMQSRKLPNIYVRALCEVLEWDEEKVRDDIKRQFFHDDWFTSVDDLLKGRSCSDFHPSPPPPPLFSSM